MGILMNDTEKNKKHKHSHARRKFKTSSASNILRSKQNLNRFVRWPRYVRLQRRRRFIHQTIKAPHVISEFYTTVDRDNSKAVFKLLKKYRYVTATKTYQFKGTKKNSDTQNIISKRNILLV